MSQIFKITRASCHCGGNRAWMILHPNGTDEMYGCICHNTLPHDAKVVGEYIDRPYRDDPMPLDETGTERKLWKRRNHLRNYGRDSYVPPTPVLDIPDRRLPR